MTVEQKLEALYNAVNKAWDDAFDEWEWEPNKENPKQFMLGARTPRYGFRFYLAGCRDTYGGWIWIEYEPEEDLVGIYIEDRPILETMKDELKNLFEKYSPFNMKVTYEDGYTPIIFRKEKVELENLLKYFTEFKEAYDKHYPLFYMFSVSAKRWYDGFYIAGSDC